MGGYADCITNNKNKLTGLLIDPDMLKSTFTDEYTTNQTNQAILTPAPGFKLCIRHIELVTDDTAAVVSLDFSTSGQKVFRKYASNDLKIVSNPSHIVGGINEAITLNLSVTGGKSVFLLVNYVEHK